MSKSFSIQEVSKTVNQWKTDGYTIGFTSGVFDLLHIGHLTYLEKAKDYCDKLVVGVNSDTSVKANKGNDRPIISENHRANLVAGLKPVDLVFIFPETNNKNNILTLKPNVYIKSKDYQIASLSSAKYLKQWNGKVILVDFIENFSSTNIINTIKTIVANQVLLPLHEEIKIEKKPAIFLDRDGVINEEIEYLHNPEQFILLPNVIKGLKKLSNLGFRLIIITTQAGIGLGYFTKEDFYLVNKKMLSLFHKNGIILDRIYYCPHSKSSSCKCRKPEIALLKRAVKEVNIDLKNSYFIGDKTSDIKAGENINIKTILMKTGHFGKDYEYNIQPTFIANDLNKAADFIEADIKK